MVEADCCSGSEVEGVGSVSAGIAELSPEVLCKDPRQGRHPARLEASNLRQKIARGWQKPSRLQHPEGVNSPPRPPSPRWREEAQEETMEGGGKYRAHLMPSAPLLRYALEKSVAEILPWRAHQRLLYFILILISSVPYGYKGNPLFGRVDGSTPEILHMRDIYGRVCCKVMVRGELIVRVIDVCHCCMIWREGLKVGEDLRESDVGLGRNLSKDVTADSLKEIRRKTVPADNLKKSAANLFAAED
ncbi:hypothetical protein L1987_32910 [Smallanthus sonchifolius]|uniref:Uncharacterized protein n=1 Tax=Smallanthus sonchifolius TaxID=185202 RepID=A0ACB9HP24_9ASTR|nr:hypothetical protein L1987_32910 [Smallanthus sonchifolius]